MADVVKPSFGRLARRGAERGPLREFLMFGLGGDLYGVELTGIKEIVSPPPVTLVPRAPREVVGVCSVRGLLVTVVDLRERLKLERRPLTRRARILLSTVDSGEIIGLLVDEVRQVIRLGSGEIELAASALGGDVADSVIGVARPDGLFLILLDLKAVLSG
jgi:purine-binding chemotaxis protein CheW